MNFSNIYANLSIPVVVCQNTGDLPLVYMNVQATMLFLPTYLASSMQGDTSQGVLTDILKFETWEDYSAFTRAITATCQVQGQRCKAVTYEKRELPVTVFGNSIAGDVPNEYFVLYLFGQDAIQDDEVLNRQINLYEIINGALRAENVDESIQLLLAMAGRQMQVSRSYIFEEISPTTTRNTYEWCAEGVEPAIQNLQNLDKAEYPYDSIVNAGMFITDDVGTLSPEEGEILEMQGIKAIAIVPFYDYSGPLGYVGFDDCEQKRKWTYTEIQFLKGIAMLLVALIKRRNSEQNVIRSRNVLQLISNNLEDLIYANSLDDYRLLFVSQSLADALNTTVEELEGKVCWQVFRKDATGPCSYCPIHRLYLSPGQERSNVYTWENYIEVIGKTYLAKDTLLRWVDGTAVHVETAVDISQRIEYEQRLEYVASTDVMTGAKNRSWGAQTLDAMLGASTTPPGVLCFVDVDGLKHTNDTKGHMAGDALLVDTVRLLKRALGPNDFICRWGGDEFLLWLQGDIDAAQRTVKHVQRDMERFNQHEGKTYQLSFSYGMVPFLPGDEGGLDALVSEADRLMYENKMEKRNLLKKRRREDGLLD